MKSYLQYGSLEERSSSRSLRQPQIATASVRQIYMSSIRAVYRCLFWQVRRHFMMRSSYDHTLPNSPNGQAKPIATAVNFVACHRFASAAPVYDQACTNGVRV